MTVETVLLWVFSLMALLAHHNRLKLFFTYSDVDGTCIDLFFGGGLLSVIFFGLLGTSNKVGTAQ